jgi:Thiol-disulfide isomerase and thioredoxins
MDPIKAKRMVKVEADFMKKLSVLLIITLLISGCTSPTKVSAPGVVTSCDQIRLLESADKSALMGCLDGSGEIDFHQVKGLLINVWGSWCEGCKQEMPILLSCIKIHYLKTGRSRCLA